MTFMTTPEWLNEQETVFWRGFIETTNRVLAQVEAALKADTGIGFDDYEVLVHLSEADHSRLRMTELSDCLLHSRSRLTQRIDRMAKRGLVRRERCPGDERGTYAVMTDQGLALIQKAAPDHVRAVRQHLIDRLDGEQIQSGIEMFKQL